MAVIALAMRINLDHMSIDREDDMIHTYMMIMNEQANCFYFHYTYLKTIVTLKKIDFNQLLTL